MDDENYARRFEKYYKENQRQPIDNETVARRYVLRGFSSSQIKAKGLRLVSRGNIQIGRFLLSTSTAMWRSEGNSGLGEIVLVVVPNLPWRSLANLMGLGGYFHGNIINVGEVDFLVGILSALLLAINRQREEPDERTTTMEMLGYITLAFTLFWASMAYVSAASTRREKLYLAFIYCYAAFFVFTLAISTALKLVNSLNICGCCHEDLYLAQLIESEELPSNEPSNKPSRRGCAMTNWANFIVVLRWTVGICYLHVPLFLMTEGFEQVLPVVYWEPLGDNDTVVLHYADYKANMTSVYEDSPDTWKFFAYQTLTLDALIVLYVFGKILAQCSCVRTCFECLCCVPEPGDSLDEGMVELGNADMQITGDYEPGAGSDSEIGRAHV